MVWIDCSCCGWPQICIIILVTRIFQKVHFYSWNQEIKSIGVNRFETITMWFSIWSTWTNVREVNPRLLYKPILLSYIGYKNGLFTKWESWSCRALIFPCLGLCGGSWLVECDFFEKDIAIQRPQGCSYKTHDPSAQSALHCVCRNCYQAKNTHQCSCKERVEHINKRPDEESEHLVEFQ